MLKMAIILRQFRWKILIPDWQVNLKFKLQLKFILEFKRIDTNNDDQLSFSELLLGDRPYMEAQSRRFHKLDLNSDGRVIFLYFY